MRRALWAAVYEYCSTSRSINSARPCATRLTCARAARGLHLRVHCAALRRYLLTKLRDAGTQEVVQARASTPKLVEYSRVPQSS